MITIEMMNSGIEVKSEKVTIITNKEELNEAIDTGDYDLVYEALLRWMTNPLGPTGSDWIKLFHKSMLGILEDVLADEDTEAAHDFLDDIPHHRYIGAVWLYKQHWCGH